MVRLSVCVSLGPLVTHTLILSLLYFSTRFIFIPHPSLSLPAAGYPFHQAEVDSELMLRGGVANKGDPYTEEKGQVALDLYRQYGVKYFIIDAR